MTFLYVYKCKNDPQTTNAAYGDWESMVKRKSSFLWGGAWATRSAYSKRLFEEELAVRDLILAWQVDKQTAIGICEVTAFKQTLRGQEVFLAWREIFAPPVPINELKRTSRSLQQVKAFKRCFTATLYETTKWEAHELLQVCGSRFASRFKP